MPKVSQMTDEDLKLHMETLQLIHIRNEFKDTDHYENLKRCEKLVNGLILKAEEFEAKFDKLDNDRKDQLIQEVDDAIKLFFGEKKKPEPEPTQPSAGTQLCR